MFNAIGELPGLSRLLVLTYSTDVAEQFKNAVGKGAVDSQIRMRINGTKIGTYLEETPSDIVLLDIDLSLKSAVDDLREFVKSWGRKVAILVTSPTSSLRDIRSLIKVGVVDFIPQPIEAADLDDGLAAAMAHLAETSGEESAQDGQIVTFMHASGGAGATTLLVEAAADIGLKTLSSDTAAHVAALDFDIQFGDLAHNLDLPAEAGLINILEAPERLDASYLRSSMTRHKSGIDVLSAPDQFVPLDALTPEIAGSVLAEAKGAYDVCFVDMPLAWSDWTQAVLAMSDVVVLVTPVSVPAVRRTRRLLSVFHDMDLDNLRVLVVSSLVAKSAGSRSRQRDTSEAISRGIDYSIQFDQQTVMEASDRGVLCRQVNAKSATTKDIAKFVEGLGFQLELETTTEKPANRGRSLFGRQIRASV